MQQRIIGRYWQITLSQTFVFCVCHTSIAQDIHQRLSVLPTVVDAVGFSSDVIKCFCRSSSAVVVFYDNCLFDDETMALMIRDMETVVGGVLPRWRPEDTIHRSTAYYYPVCALFRSSSVSPALSLPTIHSPSQTQRNFVRSPHSLQILDLNLHFFFLRQTDQYPRPAMAPLTTFQLKFIR